jgi:hypothetical protein
MIAELLLLAAAPTAEAEALGLRLARAGTLATLLPLMEAKEADELVAQHRDLSPAEQAQLRATAHEVASATAERLLTAEGKAFAANLSIEDLRALVAHAESEAAQRMRAAQPKVIMATMQAAGSVDFKKDVMKAFCAKTGKGCGN